MKDHNNNEPISWLLLQVMQSIKQRLHALAEQYELSVMQLSAFMILKPDQDVPMNTLSHQLACDASSITGIVDRLEGQGLVERRDNPADRRVKMVALTKSGVALQRQTTAEVIALEDSRLRPTLTPAEHTELRRLLLKIVAGASQA